MRTTTGYYKSGALFIGHDFSRRACRKQVSLRRLAKGLCSISGVLAWVDADKNFDEFWKVINKAIQVADLKLQRVRYPEDEQPYIGIVNTVSHRYACTPSYLNGHPTRFLMRSHTHQLTIGKKGWRQEPCLNKHG